MNSKKVFLSLYYIALLLTIFVVYIPNLLPNYNEFNIYVNLSSFSIFLVFINFVLIIIFSILLFKKEINKVNILFPLLYLFFTIIVLILCVLFNKRLIIPNIHYSYYINFILINYTLLNIYAILSFNNVKKNN